MDPTFGWPDQLTDYLNKHFPGQWAYSGSFAMFCHANKAGKDCRQPNDIDVLIATGGAMVSLGALQFLQTHVNSLAEALKRPPFNGSGKSGRPGQTDAVVDKVNVSTTGEAKVDIGQSSTEYGSVDQDVEEYEHNGKKHRIIKKGKLIGALTIRQQQVKSDKSAKDLVTLASL